MKIAVFENEYESVKGAFQAANLISFNGKLEFDIYPSAQSANVDRISDYDVIFVDISLSSRSDLDGYALIQKMHAMDPSLLSKIVVLTGNNKIEEGLKQRSINASNLQIIVKPTNYEEIAEKIKNITDN
jgi:DNA-binding LytR/AlgR family response regulator